MPDLSLGSIVLLDKVQKHKPLTALEAKILREEHLIEGKRPNIYISSMVAEKTNEKSTYMKNRGIEDDYCKEMIIRYLSEFNVGARSDFEDMLINKLSETLTEEQKKNKIRNILQALKAEGKIKRIINTKNWELA